MDIVNCAALNTGVHVSLGIKASPLKEGFPGGSDGKESTCNVGGLNLKSQVQSLGQEDHLEKGMSTYSSTLAWRIPRTEEPGGLQSVGSQRVRHD